MSAVDLVCLSHLRWDFVFQRPQHLMSRFSRDRRVFYVEEAVFDTEPEHLELKRRDGNVTVVVPHVATGTTEELDAAQARLLAQLFEEQEIGDHVLWYYAPMAVAFGQPRKPLAVVYDCMDELSAFSGAAPELLEREAQLLESADLVFTGGQSLYHAKRGKNPHVYAFPSSVETAHFAKRRTTPQTRPPSRIRASGLRA
jgi:UDP-galactopyranose mutase